MPAREARHGVQRDLEGLEGGGPWELAWVLPQVLLQVLIIITGNYNFFNLLTLVLTTALLDDGNFTAEADSGRCRKTPACECQLVPDSQASSARLPTSKFPALQHSSSDPSPPVTVLLSSLAQITAGPAGPAPGMYHLRAAGLWHRALLRPGG